MAQGALNKHFNVILNGDSYNLENQEMLTEKGLSNIHSGVEAIHRLRAEKNLGLFKKMCGLPPALPQQHQRLPSRHGTPPWTGGPPATCTSVSACLGCLSWTFVTPGGCPR